MTQPNLSDNLIQVLSNSELPIQQAETTSPSESLILMNQSTLQENEVIRVELYTEIPVIHRQTVVRENVPIKQYLAEQKTD
ncbi:DUF2382 domain-containing protein [Phormidium sp. CLA17]|uniref:DUF2382 domain-containing protein n=1 Tax=Leptolyngbya sp. Cla-17 TaxID=2803751 RepID=UPI001490BD5C|nr:DUF2382 domain-containing protein [Leptolyngbya sp. Cla-17]MBM0740520.1 DUF2382 domain-containing protein [Leptolyngbya sp. Cla-17]